MWNAKKKLARERLDARLADGLPERLAPPARGWIHAIRRALGMTAEQLGERMGISRQTVDGLERSERVGTIRLESLRRAAEAMDCELVYALVPRTSLAKSVEKRALEIAHEALRRVGHSMSLEDQTVEDLDSALSRYIEEHISERDLW